MVVVYLLGLEGDSTVSLKELFIDSKKKEVFLLWVCIPLQEYLVQNSLPQDVVECNSLVSEQKKRGQMGNVAMWKTWNLYEIPQQLSPTLQVMELSTLFCAETWAIINR
jgi:hypothetical protein